MRKLHTIAAFALAGVAATGAAWVAADWVEDRSLAGVGAALAAEGADWVEMTADGLVLTLAGTAPDEPKRLRALTAAGNVVDPARIVDAMDVAAAAPLAPPRLSLEILRNRAGVSLIGLVPDQADLAGELRGLDGVSNMAAATDRPVAPETAAAWDAALDFAMDALADLPQAKISVAPGRVSIDAIAGSDSERRQLEAALERDVPDGVALTHSIAAPRPVVAPFTTRFVMAERGPRFDACVAQDAAGAERIAAAAEAAGFDGDAGCVIALGAPSATWDVAVAEAIGAVSALGEGAVTLSDADVTLVGPRGMDVETFDAAAADLDAALPDLYVLTAIRPKPEPEADAPAPEGVPEFVAARNVEGAVTLRGEVRDARQEAAVAAYGRAVLGEGRLAARHDDAVPDGWPVRVLAGLAALGKMESGEVVVSPDLVSLRGVAGDRGGEAAVSGLLSDKLGEEAAFSVSVEYDERLDPTLSIPTPQECVTRLAEVQADAKLGFAPGEPVIEASSADVLGDLVRILRDCRREIFEVGGHTDSQGREVMNQELSQARAEAVRAALIERGIAPSQLVAKGYGEAEPIGNNETETGRETNRRIVFTLFGGASQAAAARASGDAAVPSGAAETAE